MEKRVTVVDYGLGNLFSISRALRYIGAQVDMSSRPEAIRRAERLVLPGVGAFGDAMKQLRSDGLVDPILQLAQSERPLLGICLGMQLLLSVSEEFGVHQGLNIITGRVVRIRDNGRQVGPVKVPHVGWGELYPTPMGPPWPSTILRGLQAGESVYFVHSYVPVPDLQASSVAQTSYGGHQYCAAVQRGGTIGCLFHPEKSGEVGLQILRNFVGMGV